MKWPKLFKREISDIELRVKAAELAAKNPIGSGDNIYNVLKMYIFLKYGAETYSTLFKVENNIIINDSNFMDVSKLFKIK